MLKTIWKIFTLLAIIGFSTAYAQLLKLEARDEQYPIDLGYKYSQESRHLVGTMTNLQKVFPSCTIKPSSVPVQLASGSAMPDIEYKAIFGTKHLSAYVKDNDVLAMTVVKDGKILREDYFFERRASDKIHSASMAKSITSLLIGIALDEGAIKSLDEKVSTYAPALDASAYKDVTIRSLLRMSSGVRFSEDYSGNDDLGRFSTTAMGHASGSIIRALNDVTSPSKNMGNEFNYASSETAALAEVVRGATKKSMCQYLEEKIWEPIGAEFEAAWITDSHGKEIGFSHFQVTQRDLVKVGVMLVNKGVFNGKRIISESYLDEATNLARQPANFQVGKVNLLAGYGYQFWLMKQEGRFAMWGVRGQFMYIDQKSKTVMLINSVWHKRINPIAAVHTQRLFNAVVDAGSEATP